MKKTRTASRRTLVIQGEGFTFETLARRFLPDEPLKEVLDFTLEHADVTLRPGGKIALTGGINVSTDKSRLLTLAQATRMVDHCLSIIEGYWQQSPQRDLGKGFDRLFLMTIPKDLYQSAVKRLRPEIGDLIHRTATSLLHERQGRPSQESTVLVLGAFVGCENDFERAGCPEPRRKPRRLSERLVQSQQSITAD